MRSVGIVLVAVVVAALFSAAPSARADKIVFERIEKRRCVSGPGYCETARLVVMRSDGSAKRRLPRFGATTWWDVSRDGQRLVWAYKDDTIRTGTLTGKRMRIAWRGGERHTPLQPRWSPSGRQIAATLTAEPPDDWGGPYTQIFVIRPGRGRARQLHTPGVHTAAPSWSPDGRRIAAGGYRQHFTCTGPVWLPACQTTFTYGLWIIDVASGATREIPQDAPVGLPAWSPDGRTIAFSRFATPDQPEQDQLWLIRPDGAGLRQLTDLPGGGAGPSWSPNGRRLAFETDVHTQQRRNIATIRPDGSGFRRLTHGGINLDPVWSR